MKNSGGWRLGRTGRLCAFILIGTAAFAETRESIYRARPDGVSFRFENPENRLQAGFSNDGVTASHAQGRFGLRLEAFGYGSHLQLPTPAVLHAEANRVEYRRGAITEWYINDARGLEQGFTFAERPVRSSSGALTLELSLSGELTPVLDGKDIRLERDGAEVLRYAGLRAWDSDAKELPAHMEVQGNRLRLLVSDEGARYPITVDPWIQQQKLAAPGSVNGDHFGRFVTLDGNTAIVTAFYPAQNSHAAYVYVQDRAVWTVQQKLNDSGDPGFGSFAALSGETAIVGGQTGSYVLVRSGSNWSVQQKLPVAVSASLQGNTIILDTPTAVYAYVRSGAVWTQQQKLSDGGVSSLSGDTVLLNRGDHADILVRNGSVWSLQQKLTNPAHIDSATTSGDTAVLCDTTDNNNQGAAYVYQRVGLAWTLQQKLTAPDGKPQDQLGLSVSLEGGSLVIGAHLAGFADAFIRTGAGWSYVQKFVSPRPSFEFFGQSISVKGESILIGGPGGDGGLASQGPGFAYIFTAPSYITTIDSNPTGRQFTVDGGPVQTTPQTISLGSGDHTISWTTPQAGTAGTQYVFLNWSDSDTHNTRTFNFPGLTNYTANFATQFQFTSSVSPVNGGTVGPQSGFYNAGQLLQLFVFPSATATFTGWTGTGIGSYTGPVSASIISLYAPITETASFVTIGAPPPSSGLRFVPVTPCRIADTRNPVGAFGGPSLQGARDFNIPSSACGIPSTAAAYSLNVTAVPKGTLGYLTLWPTGQTQPLVSTLNSVDGRIKANAALVPAGLDGSVSVYATNPSDLVLDINGYFEAGNPNDLVFYPLTPCRIADTRGAVGSLGGPIVGSGQTRTFPVRTSVCNVPATARAYSLNITAVPAVKLGFLTAWPSGVPQPVVSTLNSLNGTIVANAALLPSGTGGDISVYVTDSSHLIVDINGYFAPPAAGGLLFYPVAPCRVADTRNAPAGPLSGPALVAQAVRPFLFSNGACQIGAAAQAYSLNATVVPPALLGYFTLWPAGLPQPVVSTLNALDGSITGNAALVPIGQGGVINAFASDATHVVFDINGYFAP